MCLDKGYDDDAVREVLEEFGFTAHIKARGEEAKGVEWVEITVILTIGLLVGVSIAD